MARAERQLAEESREQAEIASSIAAASNLAAQALLVQGQKPELSLLLAVEAVKAVPPGQDIPRAVDSALYDLLLNIGGVPLGGYEGGVSTLAFSPDSTWFASGAVDGRIHFWDVSTRKQIDPASLEYLHNESGIVAVAVSPDGRILAMGNGDGTVNLWNIESGAAVGGTLQGHTGWVSPVVFSPDGRFLITADEQGLVIVWTASGEKLHELAGHTDSITRVLIADDGTWVETVSNDGSSRNWDLSSPDPLQSDYTSSFGGDGSDFVVDIAMSPDQGQIAYAFDDQSVGLWNLDAAEWVSPTLPQSAPVFRIGYRPDGMLVVVTGGSQSTEATLWNTATAEETKVGTQTRNVWDSRLSPDGSWLATQEPESPEIRVWDLLNFAPEPIVLRGHESTVWPFTFSPNSKWLVTGDEAGSIRLWDLEALRQQWEAANQKSQTNTPTVQPTATDEQLGDALHRACQTAGRNLTEDEWAEYFPGEPYRETCPD